MSSLPIYLDYNATTPIDPRVAEAMQPYLWEHYGNPSSPHPYGVTGRRAIEHARQQVAALIGCKPAEIFFTSGGTESNNTAIKGVNSGASGTRSHLITSAIEHPAVLEPCAFLRNQGFRVSVLPVDRHGLLDPSTVARAITCDTLLVSVMHANNEVGTIQPVAEIADTAHSMGALVHTDAAQSVGKIPVDVGDLGVDLLSIAGHKLYAPKGVGALFVREGVELTKFMHGAGHEDNRRAGTENVAGIVGLGAAAEIARRELAANAANMLSLREQLWERIAAALPGVRLNGHPEHRLPNTLSVGFPGVEVDDMLVELWDQVAASAGAACHSAGVTVSTVLQAMQVPMEYAMGTLRFSTGRFTTSQQIEDAAGAIIAAACQAKTVR